MGCRKIADISRLAVDMDIHGYRPIHGYYAGIPAK